MVSEVLAKRRRPLYCIDLAIPRDIEPTIGELAQVYLYNIDDLEQVVAEGLQERQRAASAAEPLIQAAVETYAAHDAKTAATDTILSLQTHTQTTRELELTRAKAMLARGEDIDVVLQQLTHRLSNKLLHQTLMLLKQLS
jgi:glutamyl-tRNA reductase